MSDTHERPTHHRNPEQSHPYAGLEQFWDFEVERRRPRQHSYSKVTIGVAGVLGTLFLMPLVMVGMGYMGGIALILAFTVALLPGVASMWLTVEGIQGVRRSRPLPPPPTYRAIPEGRRGQTEERQLLEVIERCGEITPTRAALEATLTVDESEQLLSELAQKGHLDVRVEGNKLVYSL